MPQANYYKILDLKPEQLQNQSEQEIANLITSQYRKLALRYHPDRSGGSKEAFQELLEAYRVLKDERRRREYDNMLKQQEGVNVYGFNALTPESRARSYQALKPLIEVQKAFDSFVKDRLGDAFAKENGYASHLSTDPQTGAEVLTLSFPNKAAADSFIQLMLAQGMIKGLDKIAQEKPAEERSHFPTPFNTGIPRLTPSGMN